MPSAASRLLAVPCLIALAAASCTQKKPDDGTSTPPGTNTCAFSYAEWRECVYGKPNPNHETGEASNQACSLYATPPAPVSFEANVVPILQRACAASDCHDQDEAVEQTSGELILAHDCDNQGWTPQGCKVQSLRLTADERTAAIAALLEPSRTTADMKRVEPFMPEKSFLQYKLDGCLDPDALDVSCTALPGTKDDPTSAPCGDQMPRGELALEMDERDVFRRWIEEGARDN
jgi:hypothetical protein